MEDKLNRRQNQWKTSSMEDDVNGRQPQGKCILMEALHEADDISWPSLLITFATGSPDSHLISKKSPHKQDVAEHPHGDGHAVQEYHQTFIKCLESKVFGI